MYEKDYLASDMCTQHTHTFDAKMMYPMLSMVFESDLKYLDVEPAELRMTFVFMCKYLEKTIHRLMPVFASFFLQRSVYLELELFLICTMWL